MVAPLSKNAEHFWCYLQHLVHVTFAILQRFCLVTPLLQKNIMVLAHLAPKTGLAHQLSPENEN